MTYLSWAALYEGPSDSAYFEVLIPRVMEEMVRAYGTRNSTVPLAPAIVLARKSVAEVAKEACDARHAFHLVFIHADTGGRALEGNLASRSTKYCEAMHDLCEWPPARCIPIAPRHEIEAWMLADAEAVTDALGYVGSPNSIGLPAGAPQAEQLNDPKAVLAAAITQVRGRRRRVDVKQIAAAIAQRQLLTKLRRSRSFVDFEAKVHNALSDLGAV